MAAFADHLFVFGLYAQTAFVGEVPFWLPLITYRMLPTTALAPSNVATGSVAAVLHMLVAGL